MLGLQQKFNVSELAEVKITFFVKSVVDKFQLLDLGLQFGHAFGRLRLLARALGLTEFGLGGSSCGCSGFWCSNRSCRCFSVSAFFGYRRNACTAKIEEVLALAASSGFVWLPVIVLLEEGFEPLAKLQVVLILGFDKLWHIDVALHSVFVKGLLKDFVILDKFVVVLAVPLDFAKSKSIGVQCVHNSTVYRSCSALLNLRKPQLLVSISGNLHPTAH